MHPLLLFTEIAGKFHTTIRKSDSKTYNNFLMRMDCLCLQLQAFKLFVYFGLKSISPDQY